MQRAEIVQIAEGDILETAARLFGTSKDRLDKFDDYEGCANLFYQYQRDGQPRILRISYRHDQPVEQIQAELRFVNYLAERDVRVSRPIRSTNGNLIEITHASGMPFIAVSFVKGRGLRVPDNAYRFWEGVPIQEYFHNWGKVLGRMHRLTKSYQPLSETVRRLEMSG